MPKNIFLIAGEASGDALGAKLMRALRQESKDPLQFYGIGGDKMAAEGLTPLFPMNELSLLGFVEIIPHIPRLLGRIRQTVAEILRLRPDVAVTIDAPAFNFRVAKSLRGSGIPLVHYVAPSVWAYKPGRAGKIAGLYHHLLTLLPFEPPYFEREGLPCTYTGHPIVEEKITGGDGAAFRRRHGLSVDSPLLCMMPGSRPKELSRFLPIFKDTAELLVRDFPDLAAAIIAAPQTEESLRRETAPWPLQTIVVNASEKSDALAAGTAALAKSGTGALEFAMAGIPMVIMYRVHPLSAWMLRRMIRVPYVNLVNIVLNKPAIPEVLQEDCTAENLAGAIAALLRDESARSAQRAAMREALEMIGLGQPVPPSIKAAKAVLEVMDR